MNIIAAPIDGQVKITHIYALEPVLRALKNNDPELAIHILEKQLGVKIKDDDFAKNCLDS